MRQKVGSERFEETGSQSLLNVRDAAMEGVGELRWSFMLTPCGVGERPCVSWTVSTSWPFTVLVG